MSDPNERIVAVRAEIEARAAEQLRSLGWRKIDGLFEALTHEQRVSSRDHRPTALAPMALALLRYPPELATALAARLPSLQPTMSYNPFGTTMLAMARLDTLRELNAEQRARAGEVLALMLLGYMPSVNWSRSVYANTPFDERIRAEVNRALRAHDAELASSIITPAPPTRPGAEIAWLRRLNPAVALAFVAKYLISAILVPTLDASIGAVYGQLRTGNWVTGWFWGLTAGIAVAVIVQQTVFRPRVREMAEAETKAEARADA